MAFSSFTAVYTWRSSGSRAQLNHWFPAYGLPSLASPWKTSKESAKSDWEKTNSYVPDSNYICEIPKGVCTPAGNFFRGPQIKELKNHWPKSSPATANGLELQQYENLALRNSMTAKRHKISAASHRCKWKQVGQTYICLAFVSSCSGISVKTENKKGSPSQCWLK